MPEFVSSKQSPRVLIHSVSDLVTENCCAIAVKKSEYLGLCSPIHVSDGSFIGVLYILLTAQKPLLSSCLVHLVRLQPLLFSVSPCFFNHKVIKHGHRIDTTRPFSRKFGQ